MTTVPPYAPEWSTTHWFNTRAPLSVASLRGNVVLLHAFQVLCPGCVAHGLPQMKRARLLFSGRPLVIVGLHSVFEHHQAMNTQVLEAFLREYRIDYPVAVDEPSDSGRGIPKTMLRYGMRGTPTSILIDAQGRICREVFGADDDLLLGSAIGTLLTEREGVSERLPDPECLDACIVPNTLPDTFARAMNAR